MSEDEGQPAPPPGPEFNPQSAYPSGDQAPPPANPYPPQGPAQYPPQQYPPHQYPQPGQPYAGQPYAPGHPGMPQFPVYVLPDHPKATWALVLGIFAVAGTFLCGLPVLVSPVAWVLGAQARRDIRNAPQHWGGESKATAGMVLGIIGTVLLVLIVLVVLLIVVIAVSGSNGFDSNTGV